MTPISSATQRSRKAPFETAAIVEIVFGLQDFVARQAVRLRRRERGGELAGVQDSTRRTSGSCPWRSAADRRRASPRAASTRPANARDRGRSSRSAAASATLRPPPRYSARDRPFLPGPICEPTLVMIVIALTIAARLHPFADDRLGLAALVARRPGRIESAVSIALRPAAAKRSSRRTRSSRRPSSRTRCRRTRPARSRDRCGRAYAFASNDS